MPVVDLAHDVSIATPVEYPLAHIIFTPDPVNCNYTVTDPHFHWVYNGGRVDNNFFSATWSYTDYSTLAIDPYSPSNYDKLYAG